MRNHSFRAFLLITAALLFSVNIAAAQDHHDADSSAHTEASANSHDSEDAEGHIESHGEDHGDAHSEEHEAGHGEGHGEDHGDEKEFNATEVIMHHIADAHGFHIIDYNGHPISMPLPVLLWTDNGLVIFSSSEFHHDAEGHRVVEFAGQRFVNLHEKIYYASEEPNAHGQYVDMDADHNVANAAPLDFSITKNVFSMMLSMVIIFWLFLGTAKFYKKNGAAAPKGMAKFLEPLIVFVRDDIARPNIGEKDYKRYMPYLLTLFFFIWINNLIGLIPFFPFSANYTGNIALTMTLAVFTLLITNFSGKKYYWKHILTPPVPVALWPIMIPVELIGILSKPFALMVRLFANITAGHIIILSLVSLIFIFDTVLISPVSVAFVLFMNVLELLVAALQAYIFTLLSALFIGMAVEEHH